MPGGNRRGRGGKGRGGKGGAPSSGKSGIEGQDSASIEDVGPATTTRVEGVPWELLPCEVELAETLRRLAEASTPRERDDAIFEVLRVHPFIEVKGPPGGASPRDLGGGLGTPAEEHFRLNIRGFNRWLKTAPGRPFARLAGGPSDDGIYTVSAVLRRCMPRGLSRFAFSPGAGAADSPVAVVRGFRKFTGLTADDEDEESGATNMYEDFYFAAGASAERFTVTTKSNGENGKWAIRRIGGTTVLLAGSKNTCIAWRATEDVAESHPPCLDGTIPGPNIAAAMQRLWRAMPADTQKEFVNQVDGGGWTLMLENNCAAQEHVFPIAKDFVEFVAILDSDGVPLAQREAFAFFEKFGLPRVFSSGDLAIEGLNDRLVVEREATNREGAVLYLETDSGKPVGLLKVKTSYYVRARRTRQTFWATIVDPLIAGKLLPDEADTTGEGKPRTGWQAAAKRLRAGMRALNHVHGCAEHWEEWAAAAEGFATWWRERYEALPPGEQRLELAKRAKAKFGTTYRDYCRDAGLPGGDNS